MNQDFYNYLSAGEVSQFQNLGYLVLRPDDLRLPLTYINNLHREDNAKRQLVSTKHYDNAGSLTGSWKDIGGTTRTTTSKVRMFLRNDLIANTTYAITNMVHQIPSTQKYVYRQYSVPTITDITDRTKYCLLIANSQAAFPVLGDTFEIRILSGGTTFEYQINGGGWTGTVAIDTVVTVASYYTLYFLTTSGFTTNDTWRWRRFDSVMESSDDYAQTPFFTRYDTNVFFGVGSKDRINVLYRATSNHVMVRSLGYRPVFGRQLALYKDHLFVGNFAQDTYASTGNLILGYSDLNDFDSFAQNDLSEADTKLFRDTNVRTDVTDQYIVGLAVFNDTLFVSTQTALFAVNYVGLPYVIQTTKVFDTLGGQIIAGTRNLYIFSLAGLYAFNGAELKLLSTEHASVVTQYYATDLDLIVYNVQNTCIYWRYRGTNIVHSYNETTGEFQQITLPTLPSSGPVGFYGFPQGVVGSDTAGSYYQAVDTAGANDSDSQRAELRTPVFCAQRFPVIEITGIYFDAELGTNGTGIRVYYGYGNTVKACEDASWTDAGVWTPTIKESRFTNIRKAAKFFKLRFVWEPNSAYDIKLNYVGVDINGIAIDLKR